VHGAGIDALALELLAHEVPHGLVPHPGDECGLETKARGTDGDVGRTAADPLGEGRDVLEPAAELLPVEVDADAADCDQIEWPAHATKNSLKVRLTSPSGRSARRRRASDHRAGEPSTQKASTPMAHTASMRSRP